MTESQPQDKCQIEIRIVADPKFLCVARVAAKRISEWVGLDDAAVDAIVLAVEEALTNVIRHGYGGPCGRQIIMKFKALTTSNCKPEGMEITIRDFGKQVDPKCIKSRDLDDFRPGGLGVHIIQSVMDEVEYIPQPDEGTLLRMRKRVDPPDEVD